MPQLAAGPLKVDFRNATFYKNIPEMCGEKVVLPAHFIGVRVEAFTIAHAVNESMIVAVEHYATSLKDEV